MRRAVIGLAVVALVLYGAICFYMYVAQDSLVYPGGTTRIEPLPAPADAGLKDFQAVTLDTPDGEHLKAWWHPPEEGHGVVIYLQGNAGSIGDPWRVQRLRDIADSGLGVLGLEYRGFGGSSGHPSEPGLISDAETGDDFVTREAPGSKIVVFGDSLGTAAAIGLATKRPVAGLMLDSPFASAERLGKRRYPWLPVSLLMKDKWPSEERVKTITAPLIVAQCDHDLVVPPAEGKRLFDIAVKANSEDKFFTLNNCGHVETWRHEPTKMAALQLFHDWTATP